MDDKLKAALAGFNLTLMAYMFARWSMGPTFTTPTLLVNIAIGAAIGAVVGGIAYVAMSRS